MGRLLSGYVLCATSEGKSQKSVAIVADSVGYLEEFLIKHKGDANVAEVTPTEIRAFILYLKEKRRFDNHPLNPAQQRGLSGHTINTYLRSIRIFFSWLTAEGITNENPFHRVKIPKAPRKVVPTFSDSQISTLLGAIDTASPSGYRDYVMILMLLDTGLRVSEMAGLRLSDVSIADGMLKVLGKGNKERAVPMGRQVAHHLWRYISLCRPEPSTPRIDHVFLTRDGRPLSKDRVEKLMRRYGGKAGLTGVRSSPHTLRHTAAVSFLRNGGDVFSLQRMLGHSTLEMTRRYCELADVDVKRAHVTASPVDNLGLTHVRGPSKKRSRFPGPKQQ
ncbi:MAG: tyrosine-type recombinase/integrase [Dehalococcoidia bacterium]|nr:tyrosine-type recombinase/integrase [Dehalococcoidia bacterium]